MQLKHIFKCLLFGLIAAVHFGCEETQPIVFRDRAVVFEGLDDSYLITESQNGANAANSTITLSISRTGSDISQPETITYTASAVFTANGANANTTFAVLGATPGTVVIPANQVKATIQIGTINNLQADGRKEITINLTNSSAGTPVGYPGPNGSKKSVKVIVDDDDCPFNIDDFVGDYDITFNTATTFVWGLSGAWDLKDYGYLAVSKISKGANPNTLVDDNFFGIVEDGGFANNNTAVVIVVDPTSLTTRVDKQLLYNNAAGAGRDAWSDDATAGNIRGSINTCTKNFTVRAYIKNTSDGAIRNTITINYTKK